MGRKKINKLLSLKQVEAQTGISISRLKLVKTLFPAGFTVNEIYVDKVVDYYNKNKDKIDEQDSQSISELNKIKLSNIITLQELEIEQERKNSVNIVEVEKFMADFGIQLSSVLKAKLTKELPPKIIGVREEEVIKICKELYNSIIELLDKNIDDWSKQNDN